MRLVLTTFAVALAALALAAEPVSAQGEGLFTGEVTASRLHLRAGPGEAYQPVVTVEKGTKLVVFSRHANDASWYMVEVPGGYHAWVSGRYLEKRPDGNALVAADRVLVRPRPSTIYHQLSGRLNKGETVKVVGEQTVEGEPWYRVRVPRRIPLYASAAHVDNVGDVSIARAAAKEAGLVDDAGEAGDGGDAGDGEAGGAADGPARPAPIQTPGDKRFVVFEGETRTKIAAAKRTEDIAPIRRAVAEIDRKELSIENRERLVSLNADLLDRERRLAIIELKAREEQIKDTLDERLAEIDREYRRRLAEIRAQYDREQKEPRYIATGIVRWSPDLVGRYPAYQLLHGSKMTHYLIATQYDLSRFTGKRVGIIGIADPESGTGFHTIMVRRIEILGDE
jgi:uncharacterized protein YraI